MPLGSSPLSVTLVQWFLTSPVLLHFSLTFLNRPFFYLIFTPPLARDAKRCRDGGTELLTLRLDGHQKSFTAYVKKFMLRYLATLAMMAVKARE